MNRTEALLKAVGKEEITLGGSRHDGSISWKGRRDIEKELKAPVRESMSFSYGVEHPETVYWYACDISRHNGDFMNEESGDFSIHGKAGKIFADEVERWALDRMCSLVIEERGRIEVDMAKSRLERAVSELTK